MIKRITQEQVVAGVADHWARQYSDAHWSKDKEKQRISRELRVLKKPTAAAIDAIIGNDSWTTLGCDICGKNQKAVVTFEGKYRDPLNICDACLRRGLRSKP